MFILPSNYMCKVSSTVPTFNEINLEILTNCDVCMCSRETSREVDESWQRRRLVDGCLRDDREALKVAGRGKKERRSRV